MTKALAMQRADAQRNRARIIAAAIDCLGRDSTASMGEIAVAAGVGRNTLYGHFPNRADLIEAVLVESIRQGEYALADVDLSGSADEALTRLVDSSWRLVARARSLLEAAEGLVGPTRLRAMHAELGQRIEKLLERGRSEGVFRTDLPVEWLTAVIHSVIHGAAVEVNSGRLDPDAAADCIIRTLQPAFAAPRAN